MRTVLLGGVIAALSLPAFAADVVEAPPEPVATEVVTAFDWSGAYVGLQAGGSWIDGEFSVPGARESENFNGGFVGKFIGYNYAIDNFVVGVEGDITYTWNEKSFRALGARGDVGTDWGGSARVRLGYAFDRALLYATGGWAMANGYVETPDRDWNRTFHGWTLGAGVDYAVTDNVFVRAEYRFTDFNDRTFAGVDVDLDQHTATLGVGFKF